MTLGYISSPFHMVTPYKDQTFSSTLSAEDREWDEFVAANPHGYHEQTSMYGRTREQYGFEVDRVIVREGSEVVGGAQILIQKTPVGKFAQVWRGPLGVDGDPKRLAQVVSLIDSMASQSGIVSMRVDLLPSQHAAEGALRDHGYESSRAWAGEKRSYVLRLTHSDDDLYARLPKKTRYNMRVAKRNGITIRHGGTHDIPDFYRLYLASAEHHGFRPFPYEYLSTLWRLFAPRRKMMLCFVSDAGQPIASLLSTISGNRLYASWTGTRREQDSSNLQVAGLLYHTASCWGRDHGCELLDLQDDHPYKRRYTKDLSTWPLPLRKFYGPARAIRKRLLEWSASNPPLRRLVHNVADRRNLRPRMPW